MKKITLLLFLFTGFFVSAQTITQSNSLEISGISVYVSSLENKYYRYFELYDYQITEDYAITDVEFAIQMVDDHGLYGGTFPITVKLYSGTEDFPNGFEAGGDYILLAEEVYNVPNQYFTIYSVPISAVVPAGRNLLVEISYDKSGNNNIADVTLGFNEEGETAPSYWAVYSGSPDDYSIYEISATLGEPHHLIMSVTGVQLLGVNEDAFEEVSIYPNPSSGLININGLGNLFVEKSSITDIGGKSWDVRIAGDAIDISDLQSGIYFLTVETQKGKIVKKIIKE